MTSRNDFTSSQQILAREAARRREWRVQLSACAVALGCFVAAGLLVRPVNEIRKERQLVIDPETIKGLPPDIALLGKLGTFRALAIDWAAIRAERLKDEGKTYEALQLHETICALAPRFPQVWVNAAWNMAYNISVMQYAPEARWKWVRNGITILRDKGIQYNPKAVTLYKELAWIYWHKIGDFLDDEHLNYKRALAVDMERVLGAPPVVLDDAEYYAWFRKIVDAPRDLKALIESDVEIASLVSRLVEVQFAPDIMLLEFVARHIRPELRVADLQIEAERSDTLTADRLAVLTREDHRDAVDRLLSAVRSKVLRETLKFDLDWMMHLMVDRFGPLDWRNAFAHSLYWSSLGDELAKEHENLNRHDKLNNARSVLFSVQQLILKGRITLYPDFDDAFSSYIELMPDTRYIPFLYNEYMRLGKEYFSDHPEYREGTPGPIYMNGFVTSMHNWIELLYLEGGKENLALAENFYVWLRKNNPHPDGSTQERYLKTVDEFVMGDLLAQLATNRAAGALIRSFTQRALKQFALGLTRAGVTSLRRARQCYDYWMIDTQGDINERRKMQPFRVILRDEISTYMLHPRISPLYKVRLWKHLPLQQCQMTYDRLRPYFERLCDAQDPPWDMTVAFSEPPGMEEFRKTEIETRGAPRREDVEEGERYRP
ncbi:MAG: hypothetical protein IH961_02675 [Chloroflexi bacterium]|nr:hypothetical protein [Chloroflexota bacterium]